MTQAVSSIAKAEDDRHSIASGLESKVMAHRRLLEGVGVNVGTSFRNQREMKLQLSNQDVVLNNLANQADKIDQQLNSQQACVDNMQTIVSRTEGQSSSILTTVTHILSLVTSGLRQIAEQLKAALQMCTTFTAEMRASMARLAAFFSSIQATLQKIDDNLPAQVCVPVVRLTTALHKDWAVPYQLCQDWSTFKMYLRLILKDRFA